MSKFKKESKKNIIYSDDPYDFNEKEMLESICDFRQCNEYPGCEDCEKCSCEGCENCPSDDELWEHWHNQCELDLDDIEAEVDFYGERGSYLIIASLGLWNGRFDGGRLVEGTLSEAIKTCFEDYNKVYWQDKNLKVEATHHDGTNYFVIKKLTDRGIEFYNNHEWEMDARTLNEKLFRDAHYSHSVDFFARIYGWVKDRKEVK